MSIKAIGKQQARHKVRLLLVYLELDFATYKTVFLVRSIQLGIRLTCT
jgi:hypothetical protein